MKKPLTKDKALERLASLCSRSEQCVFDIRKKLFNWGLSRKECEEVISYLLENKYVDEARFARSYTHDKARFSSWGPLKIKMELSLRKINKVFIQEAVESIDGEIWKEGLLKTAISKSKGLDLIGEDGRNNRQKLFRYIVSRGFPSSASSKAVEIIAKRQKNQKVD